VAFGVHVRDASMFALAGDNCSMAAVNITAISNFPFMIASNGCGENGASPVIRGT